MDGCLVVGSMRQRARGEGEVGGKGILTVKIGSRPGGNLVEWRGDRECWSPLLLWILSPLKAVKVDDARRESKRDKASGGEKAQKAESSRSLVAQG